MVVCLELFAELLGLDRELATDGVLHVEYGGVELVCGDGTHGASGGREVRGVNAGQAGEQVMYVTARHKAGHGRLGWLPVGQAVDPG